MNWYLKILILNRGSSMLMRSEPLLFSLKCFLGCKKVLRRGEVWRYFGGKSRGAKTKVTYTVKSATLNSKNSSNA